MGTAATTDIIPAQQAPQQQTTPAPAPAEEKKPARQPYETAEGGAINSFASESNFIVANRMAVALSQSTIVPKDYRNNIPNCLIAMELANRIGISVLAVMQNVDIIHGKPGWSSKFLIAMVNSSDDFTKLRFRWVGERGKDTWGCYAVAKDKDNGEECEGATVDIAMAKAEKWYDRDGSKWKTMPQQMLMYRAAAFWSRIYAPEKTLGMGTSEEVEDMGPPGAIDAHVVAGPAPLPGNGEQGKRMSLTRTPAAPTAEPSPSTEQAEPKAADAPEAKAAEPALAKKERKDGAKGQKTLDIQIEKPVEPPKEDPGDVPPEWMSVPDPKDERGR